MQNIDESSSAMLLSFSNVAIASFAMAIAVAGMM